MYGSLSRAPPCVHALFRVSAARSPRAPQVRLPPPSVLFHNPQINICVWVYLGRGGSRTGSSASSCGFAHHTVLLFRLVVALWSRAVRRPRGCGIWFSSLVLYRANQCGERHRSPGVERLDCTGRERRHDAIRGLRLLACLLFFSVPLARLTGPYLCRAAFSQKARLPLLCLLHDFSARSSFWAFVGFLDVVVELSLASAGNATACIATNGSGAGGSANVFG